MRRKNIEQERHVPMRQRNMLRGHIHGLGPGRGETDYVLHELPWRSLCSERDESQQHMLQVHFAGTNDVCVGVLACLRLFVFVVIIYVCVFVCRCVCMLVCG